MEILDKQTYTQKYFKLLHDAGKLVAPPYTYSYIMANDSIQVVKEKDRFGFKVSPYSHFITPSYGSRGFDNNDCIYAFPFSLGNETGEIVNTQFLMQRDYSLINYRRFEAKLKGKAKPILYNQKDLNWFLMNKRVAKQDRCVFTCNAGQHFFLYEVDDLKVLIVWDDYYTTSINIIALTQVIPTALQHMEFNYPYTVLNVYINALCTFFSMFPCGTVFNTTLEILRGITSIIYVPLHPIACFEIRTKIKGDIEENVRIYNKFNKKQWLNNDKNRMSNDIYNMNYEKKKK